MLDYHLPDMHGIEIAARLTSATPVLLVSSDSVAGVALAEIRPTSKGRAAGLPGPPRARPRRGRAGGLTTAPAPRLTRERALARRAR